MSAGVTPSTQPDPETAAAEGSNDGVPEVKPEADSKEEGVSKTGSDGDTKQSEQPKKPSVSLRPGGGDASFSYLSLRPGGGDSSFSLRPGGGSEGFSFRPGGGMSAGSSSPFSSDSSRRSGSSSKSSHGGHQGGRGGRGGYGAGPQSAGSPVRHNRPSTSTGPKRERKVYTRETILSLKSKCKGMPTQGTMDRIPGVYKVSDEEWRAAHSNASGGSATVASPQHGGNKGEKWVPPSMRDGLNFTIDQEELRKKKFEETVRHMNGLLNKATPENYETVAPAVKASFEGSSRDEELLKKHWSLIFEKALSEPNYAFMWGNLCVQLSGGDIKTSADSIYGKFRAAVLNMSQEEFERMQKEFKVPEKDFDKDLYAKKENGTFTDDDVSELEERRVKRKKRRLGTINFIGELFKKKLLRKDLLYLCFGALLSPKLSDLPLEERCHNIEAFCILVTVVGSSLEITDPRVIPHFQRLDSILERDGQLPPRIRFKIEDVIESRQGGWTKVVGNKPQPMKIGMVHANAVKKSTGAAGPVTPELPSKVPEKVVPTRSEEELESLSNNLLEEYLASGDVSEAVICVNEMDAPYYHSKFVFFPSFPLFFFFFFFFPSFFLFFSLFYLSCIDIYLPFRFVTAAISCVLESRSWAQATSATMKLFVKLKQEIPFTYKDFSEGFVFPPPPSFLPPFFFFFFFFIFSFFLTVFFPNFRMVPFFSSLVDLGIDYPKAPTLIRDLTSEMMKAGCLPSSFVTDKFQVLDRSFQKLFFDLMSV